MDDPETTSVVEKKKEKIRSKSITQKPRIKYIVSPTREIVYI